ncbi:MAG: MopE-related protein [Sandaracinaceae bacterium]
MARVPGCEAPAELSPSCGPLVEGGWVTDNGDCNDFDDARHPSATEACDGVDSDCDGRLDPEEGSCPSPTTCIEGGMCSATDCAGLAEHEMCTTGCVRLDTVRNCGACGMGCVFGCRSGECEAPRGVAAGGNRTCGWTSTGDVSCWGSAPLGAAPGASLTPLPVALVFPPAGTIVDLDVSATHQCAILRETSGEATVYCWGGNGFGQFGSEEPRFLTEPTRMDFDMSEPTDVEVGIGFTCLAGGGRSSMLGPRLPRTPGCSRPRRLRPRLHGRRGAGRR